VLIVGLAPRYCLVAIWALYLSFVTVGGVFLGFQWDTLLLETCALALVALALPHARARGRWAAAGLGAGMIVLTVAAVPSAAALPLLLAAWAIAAVTALRAPVVGVPSAAA
jgi:hypothetical protein